MLPGETATIIGQLLSTGSFVGVSAYLATKWMNRVDAKSDQMEINRKIDAQILATELKTSFAEHKTDLKETTARLEVQLQGITDQLRIANGRTAKIEGGLLVIERVCAERHGHNGSKK